MLRMSMLACGLTLALAGAASAQTAQDFSRLAAKVGQVVYVTDRTTGVEVSGPLRQLSPFELSIDGYTFAPRPDLLIERRGDPIWDGALAGFPIGALIGGTLAAEACLDRSNWHCVLEGGLAYAVLGAVIDALHVGRTTIYRGGPGVGWRFAPLVSTRGRGVAVMLSF